MLKFRVDYIFLLILLLTEAAARQTFAASISNLNDGISAVFPEESVLKGQLEELESATPRVNLELLASNTSFRELLKSINASTATSLHDLPALTVLPLITATPSPQYREKRQEPPRRKQLRRRLKPLQKHRRPLQEGQAPQLRKQLRRRKRPKHTEQYQRKKRHYSQEYQTYPQRQNYQQEQQNHLPISIDIKHPIIPKYPQLQQTQQSPNSQQTQQQWQQLHQNIHLQQSGQMSGYQPYNQSQSLIYLWKLSLPQGVTPGAATEIEIPETSSPEPTPSDN